MTTKLVALAILFAGVSVRAGNGIDVVAVYYPHWHKYPKGTEWFGEKWDEGEWAFVKTDVPRYPGHRVPIQPLTGYLNGRDPKDVATEIALASNAGIDVFLYDYYYYGGKVTQEEAIEEGFLKAENRQLMKFALMWCYHDRRDQFRPPVDRKDRRLLMRLERTPEEFLGLIDLSIKRYFGRPEYWRKDGKLFFSIFGGWDFIPSLGKDAAARALKEARWRVAAAGLGEIHFNVQGLRPDQHDLAREVGFDSLTDYNVVPQPGPDSLMSYEDQMKASRERWAQHAKGALPYMPVVPTGWDCSPRCALDAKRPWHSDGWSAYPYVGIVTNSTPEKFERLLRDAKAYVENDPKGVNAVYINAWNEYTECPGLLPTVQDGDAWLRAVKRVFKGTALTGAVSVDVTRPGRVLPNTSQVLTVWNGVSADWSVPDNRDYPTRDFVEYVEMMSCTGGNAERDLFRNPADRSVLDDYDFTRLVTACRGILAHGAKPYLKLGNVPVKFTADYDGGEFSMNIRPPADHLVHYRYMRACAAALKAAFGRDEVRTWRFAVLTEADNIGWFRAKSKDKVEIREEYFMLYDYAAQAFEEELGGGLVFGSHLLYPGDAKISQFSVEDFVAHCARGTNAATHRVGAPLRLLTVSYYGRPDGDDASQGRCTEIRRVSEAVARAGFTNVVMGVDEGRVMTATRGRNGRDLAARAVGQSYEAAFDVRVMREIVDAGQDYFATWGYFSGPDIRFAGVPSHHYFTSRELALFKGLRRLPASVSGPLPPKEELDAVAGVSADGRTVRAVVGRFRDRLVFTNRLETAVAFRLPKAWAGRGVRVSVLTLDDRNNWFGDWQRDRIRHGIADNDFNWSPDSFSVMSGKGLREEAKRKVFESLQGAYSAKAASVRPNVRNLTVTADGLLTVPIDFAGNGASFISFLH